MSISMLAEFAFPLLIIWAILGLKTTEYYEVLIYARLLRKSVDQLTTRIFDWLDLNGVIGEDYVWWRMIGRAVSFFILAPIIALFGFFEVGIRLLVRRIHPSTLNALMA